MSATAWDAGIYYVPNNIVQYLGLTYICSLANHNTVPVSNPTYWNVSTNLTGTILPWVAPQWDGGLYYVPTQIVAYLNQYYISTVKTFPPNHNIIPTSDVTYWTPVPAGGGGGSSGVSQLVAGTNISLSPAGGTGIVTINSTASSGVSSVSGGTAISVSPTTGAVVVNNTGVTAIAVSSGITTTGATGSITLSNSGVLSVAGSGAGISANTVGGNVTIQNTGVTKFTVTSGTGLSISGSTGFVNLSLTPSFVSLATTNLNMAGYSISNVATIYGGTVGYLTIGLQYFTTINFGTNLQLNSGNNILLLAYSGNLDLESATNTTIATTSYTLTSPSTTLQTGTGTSLVLTNDANLTGKGNVVINATTGTYYLTAYGSAELTASYFNFYAHCYFNSQNLYNVGNIYILGGVLDMGTGNINNVNAINGYTNFPLSLTAGTNVTITNPATYEYVISASATYVPLATSDLDMNYFSILNVQNMSFASAGAITNLASLTLSASGVIDLGQGTVENPTQVYNNYGGIVVGGADGYLKRFQNGSGSSYLEINTTEDVSLTSLSATITIQTTTGGKFITLSSDALFLTTPSSGGHDININSGQDAFLTGLRDITVYAPATSANMIFNAPGASANVSFTSGYNFAMTAPYVTMTGNTNFNILANNVGVVGSNYIDFQSASLLFTSPYTTYTLGATGYIILKSTPNEGHLSVGTNALYSIDNQPVYSTSGIPTQPIMLTQAQQDVIYTDAAGQGRVTVSMSYNMGAGNFYQVVVTEKSTSIVTDPTVWSQYSVNSSQFTVFVSSPTRPFTNILFSWVAVGPFS